MSNPQDKTKRGKKSKPKRSGLYGRVIQGERAVVEHNEPGGCAPPVITYRRYKRRDMRADD